MAEKLRCHLPSGDLTIVSPDKGGRDRARLVADCLGGRVVWLEKRREATGNVRTINLHGKPAGETAIIVDDMVDTGGTIAAAATLLRQRGFRRLYLLAVHPLLSGKAAKGITALHFDKVIFSDAVAMPPGIAIKPRPTVIPCRQAITRALSSSSR